MPGDVIDAMLAETGGGRSYESEEAQRKMLEERLGLDVPAHVQLGRWLKGIVLHGDLGTSLWRGTPVTQEVLRKIPVTLELGIFGLLIALVISLPIGIFSAIRQDTVGDYIGHAFATACISIPPFWLGTMVVVFPSIWWGWMPPIWYSPFTEEPLENLAQIALPGAILGMATAGNNMRFMRSMMLEVLRQDYIRTAWSKGLKERIVIMRHALKNALIPVVTYFSLSIPILVSGSVILEQIFNLPGMGRLLVSSAFQRDYTIVSGVVLLIAIFILLNNLVIDVLYGVLDPKIRYK